MVAGRGGGGGREGRYGSVAYIDLGPGEAKQAERV